MGLSDDWRHGQIQIMPQFLPWAQPLWDFTVYEPYIMMEITLRWCPPVQLTQFQITSLKCQPPASEQVLQLLEFFLAISVFFPNISFNFSKGCVLLFSVSYSADFLNCVTVTWTQRQEFGFSDNAGTMTFCDSDFKDSKSTSRIAARILEPQYLLFSFLKSRLNANHTSFYKTSFCISSPGNI
jgi:hypothetical protein